MTALGRGLTIIVLVLVTPDTAQGRMQDALEDSVLVSVDIDRGYDDSRPSLSQISLLFDLLPPTRVRLAAGMSLSQLIFERYGVSDAHHAGERHASDLPETYRLLLYQLRLLNSIVDADKVFPGDILVPTLPERWLDRDSENPRAPAIITSSVRPLAEGTQSSALAAGIELHDQTIVNVDESAPDRSQFARLVFRVPRAVWDALYDQSDPVILEASSIKAQEQSLPVALLPSTSNPGLSYQLSGELTQEIRTVLAGARQTATVYILDSGWPTKAEYESSIQALRGIFDIVSDSFRIPPAVRNVPRPWKEPTNSHCIEIHEALKEFRDLDPSGRVKVVYVPLSRDQGSAETLEELVFLSNAIDLKRARAGNSQDFSPVKVQLDRKTTTYLKKQAKSIVQTLPTSLAGTFALNSQVLQALLTVANIAAARSHSVFFVNQSWTITTNAARIHFEGGMRGLAVAAAGNDPSRDIYDVARGIDFARRSYRNKDVVAVVAMDASGRRACLSSYIPQNKMAHGFVVGFPGALADGRCGTSFAAPRIAWLLAAKEAARSKSVDDPDQWALELFETVKSLRPSTDEIGLLLNASKYLTNSDHAQGPQN